MTRLALLLWIRLATTGWAGIWETPAITGDPLFFVQDEGRPAPMARLLFVPTAPPRLTKSTGDLVYEPGRDYVWKPGSREVALPPGSRIPFRTAPDLHPAPGTPNSIAATNDGKAHLLFGEGRFFHDLQVGAVYETAEKWTGPVPVGDAARLARTMERLTEKRPVKVVVLGDSISTGANASGVVGAPPGQMGYPDLIVDGLHRRFGGAVTLKNLSVGGMNAPWGIEQMPQAIAESPDLFVIAFGMNDASGHCAPAEYRGFIEKMVSAMHAARPGCDVICVAGMTANAEWKHAAPALYPAYRDQLLTLRAPGVAVADVTSIWAHVVGRKSFLDLTGNGVNHPNDFGHRLYADVILALFRAGP